ncbi:MAG: DUF3369 domain-containing protein [Spirochaetales bacterium]|nr:DUF3369 domain-containing protein [Spirochaetales bacterium]
MAKLKFKTESQVKQEPLKKETWNILVVDDDREVHTMTGFVMKDWNFEDRPIKLVSAYSSAEAKEILREDERFSLVLLDVVMEHDDSGLQLVRFIREELGNPFIRIILRTGQPGMAPIRKIVNDYEINDYKEKSELTADKLFVAVTASLRSYNHLMTIERNRQGLEKVLDATSGLFGDHSINSFADGVLVQISGLVNASEESVFLQHECCGKKFDPDEIKILAGDCSCCKAGEGAKTLADLNDPKMVQYAQKALKEKKSYFEGNDYIGYFPVSGHAFNILIFRGLNKISDFKKQLLQIFSMNASMAFKNLYLNKEVEETQQEVICTLGEVVETRSKETAHHIQRVTGMSVILGRAMGMSEEDVKTLQMATPMHDVGKIGIPDEILNKPGRLDYEEFEMMKTHTLLGYEILKGSSKYVLKTAADIALEHHERWDGKGYPYKKKGDEISLEGRITAIVDVFDALYNRRIYKEPWPLDNILQLFTEERGGHFDPALVDCFIERIDEIVAVQNAYRDAEPEL